MASAAAMETDANGITTRRLVGRHNQPVRKPMDQTTMTTRKNGSDTKIIVPASRMAITAEMVERFRRAEQARPASTYIQNS